MLKRFIERRQRQRPVENQEQWQAQEVNARHPAAVRRHDYFGNRSVIAAIRKYAIPPHRPVPKVAFLPVPAQELLASDTGVEQTQQFAALAERTFASLDAYHVLYVDPYDERTLHEGGLDRVARAQDTVIKAFAARLCAVAQVELPPELEDS